MIISLFRVTIMYIFITFLMRVMGKRQLGELRATELVVTFLISGIAEIPLQDNNIPLAHSIVTISALAAFEIIVSVLIIKIPAIRHLLMGNSIVIIKDGVLDQIELERVRVSIGELLGDLRTSGVFNIDDIQYATVETNGKISVLLKPKKRPATASMVTTGLETDKQQFLIIEDGVVGVEELALSTLSMSDINRELRKNSVEIKDVFIMTSDVDKHFCIIKKSKKTKGEVL